MQSYTTGRKSEEYCIMNQNICEERPHIIPAIIAAIMLFLALAPWPYGYYQLLRIVVCGVSVYIAFVAHSRQKIWALWLFAFIALLFNPLIRIHLSREVWQPINVICAVLFAVSIFVLNKTPETKDVEMSKEKKSKNSEKPKNVQRNNKRYSINLRRGFQRIVFVFAIVSGISCAFVSPLIVQEKIQEDNCIKLFDSEIIVRPSIFVDPVSLTFGDQALNRFKLSNYGFAVAVLAVAIAGYVGVWILWFIGLVFINFGSVLVSVMVKFISRPVIKIFRWMILGFRDEIPNKV